MADWTLIVRFGQWSFNTYFEI